MDSLVLNYGAVLMVLSKTFWIVPILKKKDMYIDYFVLISHFDLVE